MLLVGVRLLEAVILRQWVKSPICVTTLLNVTSWVILANDLTHWGRVTHICVGNLTITGSDNGLSPGRRQTIIWTNAGILSIGPLGTNFSEISIGIQTFPFRKMHFIMSSAKSPLRQWCGWNSTQHQTWRSTVSGDCMACQSTTLRLFNTDLIRYADKVC